MASEPAVAFLDWLDTLGGETGSELAFLVMIPLPFGPSFRTDASAALEALRGILSVAEAKPHKELGKLVCLRAMVDRVMKERGTQDHWDRIARDNEVMELENAVGDDLEAANGFARNRASFVSRAPKWIAAAASWSELVTGTLADATLSHWALYGDMPP